MSKVEVDFITKVIEVEVNDTQEESLAAAAAINSAARAKESENNVKACAISVTEKANAVETLYNAFTAGYGYPFTAATAADMTDTDKIYVYVGSETGYVNGNWYYNDGNDWVSGGTYNSAALESDKTLTTLNAAADAKQMGDVLRSAYTETTGKDLFVMGGINAADGEDTASSSSYYTKRMNTGYVPADIFALKVPSGYKFEIMAYQQDGTFVGTWNGSSFGLVQYWFTGDNSPVFFKQFNAAYKYRFVVATSSDAVIDFSTDPLNIKTIRTDVSLTNVGNAADAKATGDSLADLHDIVNIDIVGQINAYFNNNVITSSSGSRMIYAKVSDVKRVTVTKNPGKRLALGFTKNIPVTGSEVIGLINNMNKAAAISASVPTSANYVCVLIFNTSVDTGTYSDMLASVSIVGTKGAKDSVARKQLAALTNVEPDNYAVSKSITWHTDSVIRSATGNISSSTGLSASEYVDIEGISQILYTGLSVKISNPTHGMAFYASDKTYISGVASSTNSVGSRLEYKVIDVPENAKYARFSVTNDLISDFKLYDYEQYSNSFAVRFEQVENNTESLKTNIESIQDLSPTKLNSYIAISGNAVNRYTGATFSSPDFAATNYVDIHKYKKITYRRITFTGTSAPTQGMAFYNENKVFIVGCPTATGQAANGYIDYSINVPSDAYYARFTTRSDTEYFGDFYVYGENVLRSNILNLMAEEDETADGNVESATWLAGLVGLSQKNNGVFNVVARMRMMCDIEWTPLDEVPNLVGGSFPAYEKQKGIPYGGQLTYELWVGRSISFETFLSALKNINSVMYDFSRVGTAYKAAAWYSVNCSKAVGWALNLANAYATGGFSTDPNIRKIKNAGNYTASEIKIGDILEKPGTHTCIVTDLVYNQLGDLSQIEVSEATSPVCRRRKWSVYGYYADSFFVHFDGYNLLRYDLIDDVPPIDMESMYPYISKTLGLNYGAKSNYMLSDDVEITLMDKVSNTLNIKKNGELVDAIDITTYEDGAIYTYSPVSAGWYEVGYDGDNYRNNVLFCVNDHSASFDDGTDILTFSSSTGVLDAISYSSGGSRAHISDEFPTAEDLTNGYMELTVPAGTNYIHAVFVNDYGRAIIEIKLT